MVSLYAGVTIILFGFLVPHLSDGTLPAIFFFWLGFLLILWPSKYFRKTSVWPKWARIGLVLNITGTLLLLFFINIISNNAFSYSYFASVLLKSISFIFKPISTMFANIFPYNRIQMPDGSIQVSIGFFRSTLTSFLDVLTYLFIGIIIGKLILKQRNKVQET